MSLQDRLMAQDTLQLISVAASLSLVTSSSATGFSYNFPLMLFGIAAHEISSVTPFRHFLNLVAFSGLFDILNLFSRSSSGFVLLFEILVLIIKLPIFFSGLAKLRERGGDIQPPWAGAGGMGGWNVPSFGSGGGGGGGGGGMPGAFGYGPVRTQEGAQGGQGQGQGGAGGGAQGAAEAGSFPSTGGFRLGGDDDDATPPPRGGYQTIA